MHASPSHHRPRRRRLRPAALPAALISAALVAALLPATVAAAVDTPLQQRVFGGEDASIEDLPSLAYVLIEESPGSRTGSGCTGTVIAPDWVLTAAHCFRSDDHEVVTLVVGEPDLGVPVQAKNVIPASVVVLHPDWDPAARTGSGAEYRGDVALVRLAQSTDQPVQPLVATGTPIPVGRDAVIAGWGETMPNQQATVLQRAEVPVVDGEVCRASYGSAVFDLDRQVCAGGEVADTCAGDSGGPLLVEQDGQLWQHGVTNYGQAVPCGEHDLPAAYASVAFYRAWIEDVAGIEILPEFVADPEEAPIEVEVTDQDDDGPDPKSPVQIEITEEDGQAVVVVSGLLDTAGEPLDGAMAELFARNLALTRGEIMALLLQVLEVGGVDLSDIEVPEQSPFDDVELEHPFYADIVRAAEFGLAQGMGDGTFLPDAGMTRAQGASFLLRAVTATGVEADAGSGNGGFDDVELDDVHAGNIDALVTLGVIEGGGDFAPGFALGRGDLVGWMQYVPPVLDDPAPWRPLPVSEARNAVADGTTILRLPYPEQVEDYALRVDGTVIETFEVKLTPDADPQNGAEPDPRPLPTPPPASEVFSDVGDDDAHAGGIAWVAAAEITTGFPDGTFGPGELVTRGQMATFLVRASDDLEPSTTPPDFLDVDPDNVHASSIAAVAEAGITTGFQDGTFGPHLPVTRGQMATFLVRASDQLEPSEAPPPFADVDPGNVHAAAIAAVADAGIAGGFADGTYGPQRNVTRGQMATFLARTFLWFGPTPPGGEG